MRSRANALRTEKRTTRSAATGGRKMYEYARAILYVHVVLRISLRLGPIVIVFIPLAAAYLFCRPAQKGKVGTCIRARKEDIKTRIGNV